ncbi:ASCH domain-containing protein [bacterium]|nr:ASCH domain-containing protein [bacterium]
MKRIQYKIRPHFLSLIRSSRKKHEYRLAKKDVQIGDTLVLISNENDSDYVEAVVTSIAHYSNWKDALEKTWASDFEGLYDSLDKLIEECNSFYSEEEIAKYGINVFEFNFESK